MTRFSLIIIFIKLSLCYSFAQSDRAVANFKKTTALEHASISLSIKDLKGNSVVSVNEQVALTPASILKVITTATALEVLGGDYQYKTQIGYDASKKQIVVHGDGDPTLGSEHMFQNVSAFLDEWVMQIQRNVKDQNASLYVLDSKFGYQGVSEKWLKEDIGNYFAAGAYGISLYDNTYRLYFNTMDANIPPQIIRTEPDMKNLNFINQMSLNTSGKDNGYIWGDSFSENRILVGDIPAKRTQFSIKGDIPDPGAYLGLALKDALLQKGFTVNGVQTSKEDYFQKMHSGGEPFTSDQIFYTYSSPKLADIIRVVNVKSNNHYAEHLLRTLGRVKNPSVYSNALKDGVDEVNSFWTSRGLDTNALFMYDGSGLAPSNAVSPSFMCDVLTYMQSKSRNAESFFGSFPKAGYEGTVRNFLKGTRLAGKVFVKSGSIANVQCYAGYYVNENQKYVFAVMVNNFNKDSRREVVKAIEKLLVDCLPN